MVLRYNEIGIAQENWDRHVRLREILARTRLEDKTLMQWTSANGTMPESHDEMADRMLENLEILHRHAYQDVTRLDMYQHVGEDVYQEPGTINPTTRTLVRQALRDLSEKIYHPPNQAFHQPNPGDYGQGHRAFIADKLSELYTEMAIIEKEHGGLFNYGNGLVTQIMLMNVAQECFDAHPEKYNIINYNRLRNEEVEALLEANWLMGKDALVRLFHDNLFEPALDTYFREQELRILLSEDMGHQPKWRDAHDARLQILYEERITPLDHEHRLFSVHGPDTERSYAIRSQLLEDMGREIIVIPKGAEIQQFSEDGKIKANPQRADQDYAVCADGGLLPLTALCLAMEKQPDRFYSTHPLGREKFSVFSPEFRGFPKELMRYNHLPEGNPLPVPGYANARSAHLLNIERDFFTGLSREETKDLKSFLAPSHTLADLHDIFQDKDQYSRFMQQYANALVDIDADTNRRGYAYFESLMERARPRVERTHPAIMNRVSGFFDDKISLEETVELLSVMSTGGGASGKGFFGSLLPKEQTISIGRDENRAEMGGVFEAQNIAKHQQDWVNIIEAVNVLHELVLKEYTRRVENGERYHAYVDGSNPKSPLIDQLSKITKVVIGAADVITNEAAERKEMREMETGRNLERRAFLNMHQKSFGTYQRVLNDERVSNIGMIETNPDPTRKGERRHALVTHSYDLDASAAKEELARLNRLIEEDKTGVALRKYFEAQFKASFGDLDSGGEIHTVSDDLPQDREDTIAAAYEIIPLRNGDVRIHALHNVEEYMRFAGKALASYELADEKRNDRALNLPTRAYMLGRDRTVGAIHGSRAEGIFPGPAESRGRG